MVKNLPANAGDSGSIPGWGRSPWEGNDNPLQYSCLENLLVREAWWAALQYSGKFSWPGKSPGQRSLVGCSQWGCKELDKTE